MPTKLQLSFAADAPKGDVITICLIGKGGQSGHRQIVDGRP